VYYKLLKPRQSFLITLYHKHPFGPITCLPELIPLPEDGGSTSLRNVGVNTILHYVRNLDLKNYTNLSTLAN